MLTLLGRFRDRCAIEVFHEGLHAQQAMAKSPPDLVLMDPRLPDLDGLDLINAILQDHPETDVVALLPNGLDAIARHMLEAGAVGILTKPYQASQVEEVVARCLGIQIGLRGDIDGITLSDLVQLIHSKKWDRTVVVHSGNGKSGQIHFAGGEIRHAETDSLAGLDAFNQMVDWPQGEFEIRTGCGTKKRTVDIPTMQVLLDGLRKSDEGFHGITPDTMADEDEIGAMFESMIMEEGIDDSADEFEDLDLPPPPASPGGKTAGMRQGPEARAPKVEAPAVRLSRLLEVLRQRWDLAESCAVVDSRGFVLAGQIEDEITDNFWSQLFGATASFFDDTAERHKRGLFREAVLLGTEGSLVVLTIPRSTCLLVATTRADARIGLVLTGLESSLEEIGIALQDLAP